MTERDQHPPADLRQLCTAFADLGTRLSALDTDHTPDTIVRFALDQVPGTSSASVTVLHGNRFTTIAATDDTARGADKLQYSVGSGPCLDAIVDDTVYSAPEIAHDARWPEFGPRVHEEFGVGSMLSYRLGVEHDGAVSGLNLYGAAPHAFDEAASHVGMLLATHASLAVRAALQQERAGNLQEALLSNRDIGVAMGVLMSRHGLTRQQAFDLLRLASQRTNRRLRDIAEEVAETGALAGFPTTEGPPTPGADEPDAVR